LFCTEASVMETDGRSQRADLVGTRKESRSGTGEKVDDFTPAGSSSDVQHSPARHVTGFAGQRHRQLRRIHQRFQTTEIACAREFTNETRALLRRRQQKDEGNARNDAKYLLPIRLQSSSREQHSENGRRTSDRGLPLQVKQALGAETAIGREASVKAARFAFSK
jgi:hypothetical protein